MLNNGELTGLVAVVLPFSIPIIIILVKHQQRMAMIFRENIQVTGAREAQIENELKELRALSVQQAIALDNLADAQRKLTQALTERSDVQQRVNA